MYLKNIKTAFDIIRDNKSLYFFCIFASILTVSILNFALSEHTPIINNDFWRLETLTNFIHLLSVDTLDMIMKLLMLIFLVSGYIFLLWLSIVSVSALMHGTQTSPDDHKLTIKKGLQIGKKYMTKVLGISIFAMLTIYLLVNILTPILAAQILGQYDNPSIDNIIIFTYFLLTAIIGASVYFVFYYAINYAVIRDYSIFKSIKHGTILLARNILTSIESGIVILILTVSITFLFSALAKAFMISFQEIAMLFTSVRFLFYTFSILSIASAIMLLFMAAGLSTGISLIFWTLTFSEIEQSVAHSATASLFRRLRSKLKKIKQ